eukprot:833082-Pyramimonas_sp.AAC.1
MSCSWILASTLLQYSQSQTHRKSRNASVHLSARWISRTRSRYSLTCRNPTEHVKFATAIINFGVPDSSDTYLRRGGGFDNVTSRS